MKGQPKTNEPVRTNIASTKADFRELKSNSSATVAELKEFLRELRGKSPQEMLGVVASSQLFRATILSVILVTGAILAFTALPYFMGDEPAVATESAPTEEAPPAQLPQPPVIEPTTPASTTPPNLAPLGVNEKLPAAPNVNPLEDQGGDFLQDLE